MRKNDLLKGLEMMMEGLGLVIKEVSVEDEKVIDLKSATRSSVTKGAVKEETASKEDSGREAELEAMSYNDLKALVSKLGGKAVGKKPALIEQILGLEGNVGESDEDDTKEDDNEAEGEELTEEEMRAEIADFEVDELKDIAKEMGLSFKTKATKKQLIDSVVKDLEKLDKTLEAMGYYADDEADEVDDSEEEEDSEDEATLADDLSELELKELADLCSQFDLSTKGKKQALVDRLVKAVEDGVITEDDLFPEDSEDDEDSSEDEEMTVEEMIEDLEAKDLKAVAKELKVTVKKNDKQETILKNIMKKDEDSIYDALVKLGFADDEEEEAGEDEDSEDEEVEVSEEVKKAEDKVEDEVRAQYKKKKLKDATIKKFLEKYYEGDPDCAECNCSKEERLECYIKIQRALVDDEGELNNLNDYYERGEEGHCCGKPLTEGDNGNLVCEICGEEYTIEEE